jgi:hypothetical protein
MMAVMSPLSMFIQTVPPQIQDQNQATAPVDEEKRVAAKLEQEVAEFEKPKVVVNHEDMTLTQTLKFAFSSPTFVLITLGFSVCGFHVAFLSTHLPAYLVSSRLEKPYLNNRSFNAYFFCMIRLIMISVPLLQVR